MLTMLKISEGASLALHTAFFLVTNPERRLTTKEMASTMGASEAHLSKVLQRLVHAGLVESVRGPKGGFALAKDPRMITLLKVFEVIDGVLTPESCLLDRCVCGGRQCILGDLIETVNGLARRRLEETTLADIAANRRVNGRKAVA